MQNKGFESEEGFEARRAREKSELKSGFEGLQKVTKMASLIVFSEKPVPKYFDKTSGLTEEQLKELEARSSTVYVGKYPFRGSNTVNEAQIYTVFSQCGQIKRIIMGINRIDGSPAGFCFVEFFEREAALAAIKYLNKSEISGRAMLVDIDRGFQEGRQYGRGESGYQISDEKSYGRHRNQDRDIGEANRRRRPPPRRDLREPI
jgi:nuclear cap-binding protein subunit 2